MSPSDRVYKIFGMLLLLLRSTHLASWIIQRTQNFANLGTVSPSPYISELVQGEKGAKQFRGYTIVKIHIFKKSYLTRYYLVKNCEKKPKVYFTTF